MGEYVVYVDESGRPDFPRKPRVRRKNELFVLAGVVFEAEDYAALLRRNFMGVSIPETRATVADLARVYESVSGKEVEIKAGYVLNLDEVFMPLRTMKPDVKDRVKEDLISEFVHIVVNSSVLIVAVVIDKRKLLQKDKLPKIARDVRLLATDFLLTRLVSKLSSRIRVIHDKVEPWCEQIILDYLKEAKELGRSPLNPRLRFRPNYGRIAEIKFADSSTQPGIWAADLVANTVLRKRAGTLPGSAYGILDSTPKYFEVMYPK